MDKPKVDARRTWWDISDDTEPYGTAYWDEKGRRVTKNLAGANSRVILDRAIPFMRSAAQKEQPFFTIVWFHTHTFQWWLGLNMLVCMPMKISIPSITEAASPRWMNR